ncbi:hypothetical protein myaer102_30760 [Microcystis viridis NIES-102]|uniref:Nucleic acid-binding protein n=1 Tax=Microcystis viridis NIES-102 TaxID=213615 RepID=A0A3G9JRB5_MICVR|nr:DUF3368 domain-containing protein [Microcystis viridis]BBH40511.1 hypothetical protein myaer102_30760 [Microcystis viridis NIES-102]
MIIISDTSPLSSLALVDYLSILKDIYTNVVIPQAVANELANLTEEDIRIKAIISLNWIQVKQATNLELVACLRNEYNLDLGEAEAIALALELKADELLIDERLGRREAVRLGLSITVVLGVLLIAKNRGLIAKVKPIMESLISQANFRISHQLYEEVLQTANELD